MLAAALGAGCTGVPLRPDGSPAEEKCPQAAREAMATYGLVPGISVVMEVDATQKRTEPLIIHDGPIESETWISIEELPGHTRLLGRAWTGGPRVVIRYYSARLPDETVIPFCGVAADNGHGLPKSPGRPGYAAVQRSNAWVYIVWEFR